VSGPLLAEIDKRENWRKKFLEASDLVNVVLACRVSPK